jgi:hypothetical protein
MQYKVLMNSGGEYGSSLCNLPENFSTPLLEGAFAAG